MKEDFGKTKRSFQKFENSGQWFVFCDFDWQPSENAPTSPDGAKPDIYFRRKNNVYVWECGFPRSEKIIESYLIYGEELAKHLKFADSSFVLYDADTESVIAARDFMGNFPLFYVQSAGKFIFSFSMNALVNSRLFDLRINYSKLIEFIECDRFAPANDHTFYGDVFRLLPAHTLRLANAEIKELKRFGKFNLSKYQSLSDEELFEKFRELFVNSVKKHIEPFKKIAATLSGGLDSSSVCSVAQSFRQEPIHTFNFRPPNVEAQEDEYIEAVVEKWQNSHRTISPACSDYEAIVEITESNAQPFYTFNSTIQLDLMSAAKKNACEVFLSGHWGDQVVTHGAEYLDELARSKDWEKLRAAIEQHFDYSLDSEQAADFRNRETKRNRIELFTKNLILRNLENGSGWAKYLRMQWIWLRHFEYKIKDFFKAARRKLNSPPRSFSPKRGGIIRPDIDSRNANGEKQIAVQVLMPEEAFDGVPSKTQTNHLREIFRGYGIYGQEEYFEVYRQNFLRAAQPFFDAALLELNLCIPLRVKFADGIKRGAIRRAMKNYLPEKVARRTDKGKFTNHYARLFKELINEFRTKTPDNHRIWTIVDKNIFDKNMEKFVSEDEDYAGRLQMMLTGKKIVGAAIWLDYLEKLKTENHGKR